MYKTKWTYHGLDIDQALSIIRPAACSSQAVKTAYRAAALREHPDHGGNLETMKVVNVAHEALCEYMKQGRSWDGARAETAANEVPLTDKLRGVYDKLKHLPNIELEVCGTWLWVTGDTYPVKDQIKEAGCRFARKKAAWYWRDWEVPYQKKSRRKFSIDEIRQMHGSIELEKEEAARVAA